MHRLVPALLVLASALVATGCGREPERTEPSRVGLAVGNAKPRKAQDLGFPFVATKNTTRVGGSDAAVIAAGVARAVFPGPGRQSRAVTLADSGDWRTALAGTPLAASPVSAPLLFTDGEEIGEATSSAVRDLAPSGAAAAGGAQVIRLGDVPAPDGLRTTDVAGDDPFTIAAAIVGVISGARGRTPNRVIVVSADAPEFAMPAAAYAAKTGDPILFVERDEIPRATRTALAALQRPRIYVLGPSKVISPRVTRGLRRLGRVRRTGDRNVVANAIEFARYRDGTFGWAVTDPGHGLVFMRTGRALEAVAAAPLSASGKFGPLLLLDRSDRIPRSLRRYLLDIQPGYEGDPTRGVYNHGWIVGDQRAISVDTQARLDALLEIAPVRAASRRSSR